MLAKVPLPGHPGFEQARGKLLDISERACNVLKKLGKYKLIEEIGRGAMGEVYKALDPSIGRPVALKTISSSLVGNPELLERFYREARSAGALEHPNIVTIYELGKSGDMPFIAMEYLEGESLEKVIQRRSPLSLLEKIGFIVPVCRALEFAHNRGVVHRDIKPANVMITKDGKIKVVDFGIARFMNASHTQTDVLIGTISYMSPQMIYGQRADERSDIWALGVTFYELLCYQRPFEAENHASLMLRIAQENWKHAPIRDFVSDCPDELEAIVSKLLEKDVKRRFQTMEEVLSEIEPLWEAFRQASVAELITESEDLLRANDFLRARELLRKAHQIDSRNHRVKVLFDQVNSGIRQIQAKAQAAAIFGCAVQLQQRGSYEEARAEAEAALALDPEFSDARGLLAEIQRQIERKCAVEEGLQLARKYVAEGTLSKAAEEIRKVLEIDGQNVQGRAVQKQIQDLVARREEQKHIASLLQRARSFWAEQRYDACVQCLVEGQKEFPNDPESAKLLETARMDYGQQQRLEGLAEARSLLAAQKFDEALAKTHSLAERYPNDSAVQKLRELVLVEKEETTRREKLNAEMAVLRARVNSGKFFEAVGRGERLLKEFPHDSELADLVIFGRSELELAERKRKKEELLQGIQQKMEVENFKSAVTSAEKALARFPGDPALSSALKHARAKLKEKEDRELLQRRVAEIRAKIDRGQHTDAVDLARQTHTTLGQNDETADLLRMAEAELAQKRKRERASENQPTAAPTILEDAHDAEATQTPGGAFEFRVLAKKDSGVGNLLQSMKHDPAQLQPGEAPIQSRGLIDQPALPPTLIEFVSPSKEPLRNTAAQPETQTAETVKITLDASAGSGARTEHELMVIAPPACQGAPAREESLLHLDEPAAERVFPASTTRISFWPKVVQIFHANSIRFGAGALALVVAVVSISSVISHRHSKEDEALRTEAERLEQQKNWPAALASFETLARRHRSLANLGRDNAARLKACVEQENLLLAQARDREAAGDLAGARQIYQQLADLHGDREQDARISMQRLDAALNPPVPPSPPDTRHEESKSVSSSTSNLAAKEPPKTTVESCQLYSGDVPMRLERADNERGNGHYEDAERLYKQVLACQPNNERAISGLAKTKKGQQMEQHLPPSN